MVNPPKKLSVEDLSNLTVAANYMGINSLLDLCCAKVAALCKDKSEDDIFKLFKITETFNEEEKNKIKSENKNRRHDKFIIYGKGRK